MSPSGRSPHQAGGLVPRHVVRVGLPIPLQSLVVVHNGTREYSRAKSASDSIAKACAVNGKEQTKGRQRTPEQCHAIIS
jgi:hypothetical protein